MAHVRGAEPRMEAKRKLDEGVRNWDGGNAGVSEAPEHSCILLRSPSTEMTQLVEDVVEELANGSFEMFKRSRMETAGTGEIIPVRPYRDTSRWFTGEPAARTLPLHREHGTPFCQGGGSNRPREINVPNEMASAGGGAAEGDAAGRGAAGGGAAERSSAGRGAAEGGTAGGGTADGRFDYNFKLRNNNGDLSLQFTGDMLRVSEDRKFAIEVVSRESGRSVHLTWN